VLIAAPHAPFAEIAERLAALGWERQPDIAAIPQLVAGEPEHATWRHGGGALLSYSFQPVVRLRVLGFSGEHAALRLAEAEAAIETLDPPELVRLLRSEDIREALLGLLAAGELRPVPLYAEVKALTSHPDPRIAGAARHTLAALREEVFTIAESLPGRQAFPGTPQMRRQVLRHWAAERAYSPGEMRLVLGRALQDPDWEVRAGAMIFAARAGVTELFLPIRRLTFPRGPGEGVHRLDGRILRAAQAAALRLLDPRNDQRQLFADPRTAQIDRCVAGAEPVHIDRIFWLVTALTTPHPLAQPPGAVPEGLVERDGVWRASGIDGEFVWIPPVEHWVGAPGTDTEPCTLRRVVSPGFFISREPVLRDCRPDRAGSMVEELSRASGLEVGIPTAEWREMSLWGADARLFPWGNGDERLPLPCEGPWGVVAMEEAEWVVRGGEMATCAGLARGLRCQGASPDAVAALRLIVTV
jgi:hypothetical protein